MQEEPLPHRRQARTRPPTRSSEKPDTAVGRWGMRDRRYNNGPDPQVLPALMTVATRQHPHVRDRLARLADAPRSGRSLTHGPQVRALLIAKACTRPPDTGSGQRRERWTHCELAGEVGMSES